MSDAWDSYIAQRQQNSAVVNQAQGAQVQPQAAVDALKVAPQVGVPASVGMHDPAPLAAQAQQQTDAATLRTSPPLRSFVASDPAKAVAVKDDYAPLARVGALARVDMSLGSYLGQGGPLGDVANAYHESAELGRRAAMREFQATITRNPLRIVASQLTEKWADLGRLTSPLAAVSEPMARLLFQLPASTQSKVLEARGQAQPAEITPEEKAQGAELAANLFTSVLPLPKIPTRFGRMVRDEGFIPWETQPRITGQVERPVDAEFEDIKPPGVSPTSDLIHVAQADVDATHAATMQQALTETATHSRSPTLAQDFLENHTAIGGETVNVPAQSIAKLWQEGHEVFTDHAPAVQRGLLTGADVEVSLSTYLTETAGKPFAEELNALTNFRQSGVSVEEGKALSAEGGEAEGEATAEGAKLTPRSFTPPEDVEPAGVEAIAARADAAVQQVFKEHALSSLFENGKAAGLTEGQLARYSAAIEEAQAALHDKLLQRSYSQIRRERTPDWQAALALHTEQARNDILGQRNVKAYTAIRDPLFKLDTETSAALYPDLALPKALTKRGGLHPDEAAELAGYGSGAELVADLHHLFNAVEAHGGFEGYVKARAKAFAEEQSRGLLGYDVSPEGMLSAAREAFTVPEIADVLTKDLAEFAKENGLPFDKAAVRELAEEQFNALTVAEASKPRTFAETMRKLGNKAEAALLDNKPIEAFHLKQQQLLQWHQLREAFKLAKELAKDAKVWRRIARKPTVGSTSQDAVNWVKDILAQMGVRVKGNPADLTHPISGYPSLHSFITAKNGVGGDIIWAPVPRVGSTGELTVAQYRAVSDMITSILKNGRREREVQVGDARRDLEQMVDEGVHQLNRYTKVITHEEMTDPSVLQRIERARRYADAWLVRLEQLLRDFGERDINSPFFQVVSMKLEAAKGWSIDQRTELAAHFAGLNKELGKGFDTWMKAKLPEVGAHSAVRTLHGDTIFNRNKDIVVAALHLGDKEALRKFAEGYGTTPEVIEAAVHSVGTDQMWKFVEGMWEAFERFRPEIEKQFFTRTGVHPQMVEARPFSIPEGGRATPRRVAGGYFPVMYDPTKMPKEWVELLDPNAMLGDTRYVRATPANKYIKERTGVSAPVQMNLDQIHSRLNQVIHDLAFRDALIDANKFLLHPRMTAAIARKYGPEYVGKIRRNLERIARSESTDTNENRAVSAAADWLTEGQMINMIGLSPTTVIKHGTTAFFQPMAEVGVGRYAAAFADYLRDVNSVGREAEVESPEIRHIISMYGEDSYRQFLALTEKTGLTAKYRRFAFHTIGFVNKQIAIATYNAAKEMLRDKSPGAEEAVVQAGANQIVRQALGSTGVSDAPDALSAGKGVPGRFYRLQNNFLTFFSHMYNKSREIPQSLGYAGEKVDLSRAVALLITSITIPVLVDAVAGREVKRMGGWVGGLAASLLHQVTAPVPGLNTAVAAGLHIASNGAYHETEAPTASFGEAVGANIHDVIAALKHREWRNEYTRHALVTGGYIAKAPGLEASRLEGFLHDMATGKEQSKPLAQKVEDFIYGPSAHETPSSGAHR